MADPVFSWQRVKSALGGDAYRFITNYLVRGKFDENDNLIGFINPRTELEAALGGTTSTPLNLTFAEASSPFSVAGKSSVIVGQLTSDLVVADPTGAEVGQVLTYSFEQDNLGGHALTVHGVEMPLGQAGQVLACQFQYRGTGKWAQMFGTIPWSGTPSAVGFGDSQSLNTWVTPAVSTSAVTETLTVNDGQVGQVMVIVPDTGVFQKTVAVKAGAANSKVFSESRGGFVRLNGNTDAIKIGSTTPLNIPQVSTIMVLARVPEAAVTGYSGAHDLLVTSQLHTDTNPLFRLSVCGSTHAVSGKRSKIVVDRATNNGVSGYKTSDSVDAGYATPYYLFGAAAAKTDTEWFCAWAIGGAATDNVTVGNSISANGSTQSYKDQLTVAHSVYGYESNNLISARNGGSGHRYVAGSAEFTASSDATGAMTVSAVASGTIELGALLSPFGYGDLYVYAQTSGTPGGVGVYDVRRTINSAKPLNVASQTVTCGGFINNLTNVDLIIRPGTGSTHPIDIARVVIINKRLSRDEMQYIGNGAHPEVLSNDYLCFDFGSLPDNCSVFAGAPTFNPTIDSPRLQKYHGLNTSPIVLSANNGRLV